MRQAFMGTRCNSGAVPAAVSSFIFPAQCHCPGNPNPGWEGAGKRSKPEDRPMHFHQAFGGKAKDERDRILIDKQSLSFKLPAQGHIPFTFEPAS